MYEASRGDVVERVDVVVWGYCPVILTVYTRIAVEWGGGRS